VNAPYYFDLLTEKVNPAFCSKMRNCSIRSVILLQDNVRSHTAQLTTNVLEKMHWEVLPHPPYSPDLSPCDFYLFEPLKEALSDSQFQDDDGVAEFAHEWLRAQLKTFYKRIIMKLSQR
jgi:histone-lysine N-methyltransferase SETMAR